ncbi:hypothetical protein BD414DRAFT_415840 [Trametes punicea]|nr:hypothetical protein BD414DRAFT_415840 [Trametes punicea]
MPSYYVDTSLCYCSLCDRYFPDTVARAQHVRYSRNHPMCEKCNVRFANRNSLRVHYTVSRRHHYCSACDQHFRSPAGLRAHIELTAIHGGGDSDDDDDDDSIDDSYEGWEDDVGEARYPDENDQEEPPVSDDEEISPDEEYWSEDDEPNPLDDGSYSGYAPVPAGFRQRADSIDVRAMVEADEGDDSLKDTSCVALPQEKPPPPASACLLNCPVCIEPTSTPTATSCGHVFCSSCIRRALRVERKCPVCRRNAIPAELRRLFLNVAA